MVKIGYNELTAILGGHTMAEKQIGFIGFGLIGGSIAQKMKMNQPDISILATARHQETISTAYEMGLIDNKELLPLEAFSDCDYLFLCAPVQKNIEYLTKLKDIVSPGCIITDVGSTKGEIHEAVISLGMEESFIGGHPMTGSEKTGIKSASPYLLENAYYLITPTSKTTEQQLQAYVSMILSLGSIPLVIDWDAHDFACGSISHLPHMVAYSLVNLIKNLDDKQETMKTIAAGGFRDITRIASSSPEMWTHISLSNQKQLLRLMDLYIEELEKLRNDIRELQAQSLKDYFQSAKDYRDSFALPSKNHALIFELYLDLVDEAGGIATIATILAGKGVNIKNIGIIHNREFEEGVLRIEFYDQNALDLAAVLLKEKNYHIYHRA